MLVTENLPIQGASVLQPASSPPPVEMKLSVVSIPKVEIEKWQLLSIVASPSQRGFGGVHRAK